MKHILCLPILIMCSLTTASGQRRATWTDTDDAYSILQGKYREDCVPDGDVEGIVRELQAIRKAMPALASVHEPGRYAPQELTFSPVALLSPSLSKEEAVVRIQQMPLHPQATGIDDLDKLNRKFGAVAMGTIFEDWLSLYFDKRLDMECVAEQYKPFMGDRVEPNYLMGDGNHIYRAEMAGEPIHYVFRIGSGDCPAGCIHETVFYLNLYSQAGDYRIEQVDGPTLHHSLWGYPKRFPLRIFADYDDLIRQTASNDWSLRLHAVSALGRVYATGGSGLGEDDMEDRPVGSGNAKRTAAMTEKIKQSREDVKLLLEIRATSDSDDDVRMAAKGALRAAEYWNKAQK